MGTVEGGSKLTIRRVPLVCPRGSRVAVTSDVPEWRQHCNAMDAPSLVTVLGPGIVAPPSLVMGC